jgi:hypothetical protein
VFTGNRVSIWRWRDDFQNDFAARMAWCVLSPQEANHAPFAAEPGITAQRVKSGAGFFLDAGEWTDPDGDSLSFVWFDYPEAGTLRGPVPPGSAENLRMVYVVAPVVEQEKTLHYILRVTDKGTPPLSRYRRYIVTVEP